MGYYFIGKSKFRTDKKHAQERNERKTNGAKQEHPTTVDST
jgi:hypothetical protein